jgi:plasmid stability protein
MATMPRPIRLQRGTFERLAEDAARHHEDIDSAAERILRNHLAAAGLDSASALATLGRIKTLRAKMKPGTGAVKLILEGRAELERRAS